MVSANDYYPFGMAMPGRRFSLDNSLYRYGFNGKELDKELSGTTTYDYGFRIYNPGVGRFLSVDPLTSDYPWYTPYQFAGNSPIANIDLDGAEPKSSIKGLYKGERFSTTEDKFDLRGVSVGKETKIWNWHAGGLKTGHGNETTSAGWYSSEDYVKELSKSAAARELASETGLSRWMSSTPFGTEELSGFIGSGLGDNAANHLIAASWQIANVVNKSKTGIIEPSPVNVEDIIGAGLLFKVGFKTIGKITARNIAAKEVTFYRAMSNAEYAALESSGGLSYMEGKELFVSSSANYSRAYLQKSGYDVLVQFNMKPGAMNYFNQVGVMHRTAAGTSGWAGRGSLLWKSEQGVMNLGLQSNTHMFNPWINSFKVIK